MWYYSLTQAIKACWEFANIKRLYVSGEYLERPPERQSMWKAGVQVSLIQLTYTSILDGYALTCLQNKPKNLHESISFRYHLYLLTL